MSLFGSDELPETFPDVRATDLNGDDLTLPADLPAELALVIVSFRDEMDPLADQWARLGHSIEERHPGRFAVLETPVIGRGMKLFGGLATAGIRNQVEGDKEHARTLPIYVNKKSFRKALHLSKDGDVYPFLVHRETTRILWGGRGEIDMHEVEGLEEAVTKALESPPDPLPQPEPPADESAPDPEDSRPDSD